MPQALAELRLNRRRSDRDRDPGVLEDRLQPRQRSVGAGRVRGHRHGARVQAPHEGDHVRKTGGDEDNRAFTGEPVALEPGGHGAGLAVELPVGQARLLALPIQQEGHRKVIRLMNCAPAEELDE